MIEIKLTGMCEGCTHADIDLQSVELEANGRLYQKNWYAYCIHKDACEAIRDKMIEQQKVIDQSFSELDQQNAEEMKIGDRIKQRLAEIGMSQRELAQAVNVTEVSMSRYIANNRTPKGPLINAIAKTIDVSCDWLLGMKGDAE